MDRTPADFEIGPATDGDFEAVVALLERSALPDAGLAEHRDALLVARAGDRVVGCAALELYGEQALLRSVAVDDAMRGRGLGVLLTEAALNRARGEGARTVYLLTETAARFFPRFGFEVVERSSVRGDVTRSVEFTTACPSTATVMTLDLTHPSQGTSPDPR